MSKRPLSSAFLTCGLLLPAVLTAQGPGIPPSTRQQFPADPKASVPAVAQLMRSTTSELADVVTRFAADQAALQRRYDGDDSSAQRRRLRAFFMAWREQLAAHDFDRLSQEGKVDYVLLDNHLRYQLDLMTREERQLAEVTPLLPFADTLLALHEARRDLLTINGQQSAHTLAMVTLQVDSLRQLLEPAPARGPGDSARAPRAAAPRVSRTAGNRAAERLDRIRATVGQWYRFYSGYDPLFTWWAANPYQKLDEAMRRYAQTIRQRVVGIQGANAAPAMAAAGAAPGGGAGAAAPPPRNAAAANEPIIGDPIGAEGLAMDLRHAMVPYTADELIAIAEREYAFNEAEAKKAARQMGFGDDWKAAMEKVKNAYVEPGRQPDLIRDLANEAEAFFGKHDWVTIPALAREDWRMEMLSPERQRVSPFFLGGENILVSYPTNDMTDEEKMMSMRGNNPHFSRATVFHELNPGHHLQGFMTARYNTHRRLFNTPFWNEGMALYWEFFLWDHDFHVRPEDRLGALAWRMHRSARIVFSLSFHLGKMTPEQCIAYLVDKVPFERANSEAEVRRSFNGSYSPIYQAAYMLGGLQLRALYKELVLSGRMKDREFHDALYRGGPMPIAMVRARVAGTPLTRDGAAPWRFAEQLPPHRPFPVR
ncbi:MAG: DUF885 family protein [Gemmatimonas sp.]|uniref:DUF885 family protein n=1 Tax=Gemmatimonas sp. TaxID=1962908 RepID=UPI0022C74F2A|nr:DUF885 family protein [Gemmatimonas sp.]MCZ8012054.1 DUF885 family protein [Gemmatimonas sp.]MCZ8267374.1 DUF885 family protein [Gemmatimonas sp.]